MKTVLKFIPQESLVKWFFFGAIVFALLGFSVVGVFWAEVPPQVPLFYSKPWGQEQLAKPGWLFLPLALSSLMFSGNVFFGKRVSNYPLVRGVLVTGGAVGVILAVVTVIRIILVVIF